MTLIDLLYILAALVGIVAFIDAKRDLFAKLANRFLLDLFDDVVLDEWDETVDVKRNGSTSVKVTMTGHVNFDALSEKKVDVITENPCDVGDIGFWAKNERTGEPLDPIFHIFDKHYKQVGIPMGNVKAKQSFKMSFGYSLPSYISFKRGAYHSHPAYHNERLLRMRITFERGILVSPASVRGEETTCGGVKKPINEKNKPSLVSNNPPVILLELSRAKKGSTYEISWHPTLNRNH